MDKQLATTLMEILLGLGQPLNDAVELIEQIPEEAEKLKFKRGIAEIMGRLWTDLEFEIVRQYPELDPDKDTEWFRALKAKRAAK
jgi:hypothetical protein